MVGSNNWGNCDRKDQEKEDCVNDLKKCFRAKEKQQDARETNTEAALWERREGDRTGVQGGRLRRIKAM